MRLKNRTKSLKIMRANGYQAGTKKSDVRKYTRYEASRPLELIQMDILEVYINKLKVHIILFIDDYSRFILGLSALTETSIYSVIKLVDMALTAIGLSRIVQDIAIRKCSEWLNSIFGSTKYGAAAKKRIQEQIGKMSTLTITQEETAWEWIAPLLNVKSGQESVTSIS